MFRTTVGRSTILRFAARRYSSQPPLKPITESATKQTSPEPEPSSSSPSVSPAKSMDYSSSASSDLESQSKDALPDSSVSTKDYLRDLAEQQAIALRHRTHHLVQSLQATFSQLGGRINNVTGYDEIEALKKGVVLQEARISAARAAAREAKLAYELAVEERSNSQREVNDLLQRKSSWKTPDLNRFMELVQEEHLREQEELRSKNAVRQTEEDVEKEFRDLLQLILARYHEEQVWSDKIRSLSTYGQMAVLGVNVVVFLMAIVLVEPWKRKRLAQTFERKVEELAVTHQQAVDHGIGVLRERLDAREEMLSHLISAVAIGEAKRDPAPAVSEKPPDEYAARTTPPDLPLASVAGYVTSGALVAGIIGWLIGRS